MQVRVSTPSSTCSDTKMWKPLRFMLTWLTIRASQPHHAETKDNSTTESRRSGLNQFVVLFLREMKPKILFSGHKHGKMGTNRIGSHFSLYLATIKQLQIRRKIKSSKKSYYFKYDSQININHWPTGEKAIRHKKILLNCSMFSETRNNNT